MIEVCEVAWPPGRGMLIRHGRGLEMRMLVIYNRDPGSQQEVVRLVSQQRSAIGWDAITNKHVLDVPIDVVDQLCDALQRAKVVRAESMKEGAF